MPKKSIFPKATSKEWIQPRWRKFLLECCRCGLVHSMNFRIVSVRPDGTLWIHPRIKGHHLQMKAKPITRREARKRKVAAERK